MLHTKLQGYRLTVWSWPLVLTNLYVLIKTTLITNFKAKCSKLSIKSYVLAFSHSWLWRKIGQGQHKVIIWTILVVQKLYIKLQDYRSTGSGAEDFNGFYHIWVWWPYCSFEHIFVPSDPGASKWDSVTIGPVAFEEMFETVKLWAFWVQGQTMTLSSSTDKS